MIIEQAQKTVDNWIKTFGVRYFNEARRFLLIYSKYAYYECENLQIQSCEVFSE